MTNQAERCDEVTPADAMDVETDVRPRYEPMLAAAAGRVMHEIRRAEAGMVASVDYSSRLYEHAARLWGSVHIRRHEDYIAIGPLGSRDDTLLVWRTGGRVATGCFEGTLAAFKEQLESDYARRLEHCHPSEVERIQRHLRDYRNAIAFIEGLGVATESKGY